MRGLIVGGICIDYDPQGAHAEPCGWWHGGVCDCRPEMLAARAVAVHCHECDYVHGYDGATPCNCLGRCICERDDDCPCVAAGLPPAVAEAPDPDDDRSDA